MRWTARLALAAVLVTLLPVAALAQSEDADAKEVQAYRLTMPKLRQLNQAGLEAAKLRQANPSSRGLDAKKKELQALQEKETLTRAEQDRLSVLEREISDAEEAAEDSDDSSAKSLSDMARQIESDPIFSGALRKVGIPGREAAVMMLALFQAGFTAEMLESGTIKQIPKTANAENVKFYQVNKAELQSLQGLSQKPD